MSRKKIVEKLANCIEAKYESLSENTNKISKTIYRAGNDYFL